MSLTEKDHSAPSMAMAANGMWYLSCAAQQAAYIQGVYPGPKAGRRAKEAESSVLI